ncbi:hypothetical protein [Granulosicoccus antarcticus]|uniref:Uncharacterized protein n=1 Tax=Granulosicoccus antarcticus IMCC3135 TaxID=1192854 RepID=A0A2Z2NTV5_9GAMM|nr:hypothetical protein [Granulosicoccus antarcticus]ASJ74992.1 hypothetical protein IMCC3135_24630 [Granulosicoccus antarcticus IMCC3135]
MHADDLRMAVSKIVDILNKSEIRAVVDQYRSAKGDQRTAAAARLGHAGALILDRFDAMSASERRVVNCLHLESLGSTDYWQNLLSNVDDPRQQQAEIVRLASRVMFASSHLPAMVSLLGTVKDDSARAEALESGEGRLHIRLTDAGERASDPDRIARAIDGIDMLYSACASIARKPAMDLRLDSIGSKRKKDRELQFTGEKDSVAAVFAVIDSIPAALADIDSDQDIDLDVVVQSLPIFDDLNTLASLGNFSNKDLKDISDTMHQGALLSLESGAILMEPVKSTPAPATTAAAVPEKMVVPEKVVPVVAAEVPVQVQQPHSELADERPVVSEAEPQAEVERDEHYDRYLREREAMLRQPAVEGVNGQSVPGLNPSQADSARTDDQVRRDAVDELLKSLNQTRSS